MNILIKPVTNSKNDGSEPESLNRFGFVVDQSATKIEIQKLVVEETYDVTVESVRTMVCIGKKELEVLNPVSSLEEQRLIRNSDCYFVWKGD